MAHVKHERIIMAQCVDALVKVTSLDLLMPAQTGFHGLRHSGRERGAGLWRLYQSGKINWAILFELRGGGPKTHGLLAGHIFV